MLRIGGYSANFNTVKQKVILQKAILQKAILQKAILQKAILQKALLIVNKKPQTTQVRKNEVKLYMSFSVNPG